MNGSLIVANQAVVRTGRISIILTAPHTRPVDNLTGLSGVVWPGPTVVATHSLLTIAAEFTRARSDNAVGSTSTSVLAKATRAWASIAIWPTTDDNLHSGRAHRTPAR